jgi:hypothetical protein
MFGPLLKRGRAAFFARERRRANEALPHRPEHPRRATCSPPIIVAITMTAPGSELTGRVDRNEEVQRLRDGAQDTAMVELKATVRDNIVQIRNDVQETRQDVKDLSRYVRGSKGM